MNIIKYFILKFFVILNYYFKNGIQDHFQKPCPLGSLYYCLSWKTSLAHRT